MPDVLRPPGRTLARVRSDKRRGETMAQNVKLTDWRGQDVLDQSGERVGKLEDVYYDTETDESVFASLKTGLLGRHVVFVPLDGATVGRAYVQVPYEKAMISDSPSIAADSELTAEDEPRLFGYYGTEYVAPTTQSGRRLARR